MCTPFYRGRDFIYRWAFSYIPRRETGFMLITFSFGGAAESEHTDLVVVSLLISPLLVAAAVAFPILLSLPSLPSLLLPSCDLRRGLWLRPASCNLTC